MLALLFLQTNSQFDFHTLVIRSGSPPRDPFALPCLANSLLLVPPRQHHKRTRWPVDSVGCNGQRLYSSESIFRQCPGRCYGEIISLLCDSVRHRSVWCLSDSGPAECDYQLRPLWNTPRALRYHFANIHGGHTRSLLDHCREIAAVDCAEKSISVCSDCRAHFWQMGSGVCDDPLGFDGVWRRNSESLDGVTESATLWVENLLRRVWSLILCVADHNRGLLMSLNVAGESQEYEVRKRRGERWNGVKLGVYFQGIGDRFGDNYQQCGFIDLVLHYFGFQEGVQQE